MKKISKKKIILIMLIIFIIALLCIITIVLMKNNVNNNIELTIEQSDFDTQKSTTSLSGTVSSAEEKIVSVSYKVYSELDNKEGSATGEAEINGDTWKVDKMFLKSGNNEVVIIAETESDSTEKSINIYYDIGKPYELNEENIEYDERTNTEYVNNMIIILFDSNASEERKNQIIEEINGEVVGRADVLLYDIKVGKKSLDELQSICDNLEQRYEEVLSAFVDKIENISSTTIPNDKWGSTLFSKEDWNEENPNGTNWGLEAIQATSAWDYNERLSHINIAVVDTGFDLDHKDLNGVFIPSTDWMESSNDYKYYNTDTQKENIDSHGTHVAGIIGAIANNKKEGITGLLWDTNIIYTDWQPNERRQSWDTTSMILKSLVYSVKAGAKVINYSVSFSYGQKIDESACEMTGNDRSTINASQNWKDEQAQTASKCMYDLRKQGHDFIVVQGSGNGIQIKNSSNIWENIAVDATNGGFWSSVTKDNVFGTTEEEKQDILDRIIIVGAAKRNEDGNYQQCVFSNGGERVDICAPGKDIYSTIVDNKYDDDDGTSVAAPMVTGVCGMVWSVNSDFTGAEVKEIVCNYTSITVDDNPDEKHPLENTYKMVNAKLAVEEAIRRTDNQGTVSAVVKEEGTEKALSDVTVKFKSKTESVSRTTKTDENGAFKINLPVGNYDISLSSETHMCNEYMSVMVEKDVDRVLQTPLYMTTKIRTSKVAGAVYDSTENTPIANVTIEVVANTNINESLDPITTATTDENGRFTLNLPSGSYSLSFHHDEYEYYGTTVKVESDIDISMDNILLTKKSVDSLQYEMREEYFEHKTSSGVLFYTNKITYPYFTGNSEIENQLNQHYSEQVAEYKNKNTENIDEWYENVSKNQYALNYLPLYENTEINVIYNKNGYISVLSNTYDLNDGGIAHRYSWATTYQISTAKESLYSDFIYGTDEEIEMLLQLYLDKAKINQTYIYEGWENNTSFALTEDGLCFYFHVGDSVPKKKIIIPYTENDSPVISAKELLSLENSQSNTSETGNGLIEGVVKNNQTNKPIQGLSVELLNYENQQTAITKTDENGFFSFSVPYNTYTVIITNTDYDNYKNECTLTRENNIYLGDIKLIPKSSNQQHQDQQSQIIELCCQAINNNDSSLLNPYIYDGFGEDWNNNKIYDVIRTFHNKNDEDYEEYKSCLPLKTEEIVENRNFTRTELQEGAQHKLELHWHYSDEQKIPYEVILSKATEGYEVDFDNEVFLSIAIVKIEEKWYIWYFDI